MDPKKSKAAATAHPLLRPQTMQPLSGLEQNVPGLDGPDYVALVIEWTDLDDLYDPDNVASVVSSEMVLEPRPAALTGRAIAAALGALGALALAVWGIHRLRAA